MVINGQHENIMHDMMQFMVLFHYFILKFFSQRHKYFWWVLKVEMRTVRYQGANSPLAQPFELHCRRFGCPNIFTDRRSASLWSFLVRDTSVSGGCRKLNCRRSDLWGRTVRLLRRPNFTTEDSNFHVLTCGRFGQVVRTVSRPLTGLIRDIFFSECSGYSFPHRVFICSNVLLNYLTKYTQHSWNLMLQRKIFHYFMQYLFKFNLYQFYIYNRKNLNYQKDSKINQILTWKNLWCLLPIKKWENWFCSTERSRLP